MSALSLNRALAKLQGKGRGPNGALSQSQIARVLRQHGLDTGDGTKPTKRARRAVE